MSEDYSGKEKREFLRYRHEKPVQFKVIRSSQDKTVASKLFDAVSKNLSASGILFSASKAPEISSLLVLEVDYSTSRICQEIEENAFIQNDKLVGKVVRIEDNDQGSYDVGVAFVKKSDELPKNIQDIVNS